MSMSRMTDQASAIWLRHELPVQRKRIVAGCDAMMRGSAVELRRQRTHSYMEVRCRLAFATQHSTSMVLQVHCHR